MINMKGKIGVAVFAALMMSCKKHEPKIPVTDVPEIVNLNAQFLGEFSGVWVKKEESYYHATDDPDPSYPLIINSYGEGLITVNPIGTDSLELLPETYFSGCSSQPMNKFPIDTLYPEIEVSCEPSSSCYVRFAACFRSEDFDSLYIETKWGCYSGGNAEESYYYTQYNFSLKRIE